MNLGGLIFCTFIKFFEKLVVQDLTSGGRICYQKNPALFNQIAETMPDVRFLWIGDGELKDELSAENVEISGWVDRKTALTKSMSADVFVLTSLWEGLPISLLEAMYMKKPCVVSNVIGNHDVIHNGENGFVCDKPSEFVEAIRNIQRDMSGQAFEGELGAASVYPKAVVTGESRRLVAKAYEDVLEKYNTQVMARSYAEIYVGGVQHKLIVVLLVGRWRFNKYYAAAERAVA